MNNPNTNTSIVEVAAAVLQKADGSLLLAQRPAGKIWAGYWEFPGGKIEPGETAQHALVRELREELGITVATAYPWLTRVFAYPHATVRLHFFRVTQWQGELHPHEGQQFSWQRVQDVSVAPILPANGPVLRALQLPDVYAISNAGELGVGEYLRRLEAALNRGVKWLQLREKTLASETLEHLARKILPLARHHDAHLIINTDIKLARRIGADGVHLTSVQLAGLCERPDVTWCGASCHNAAELRQAEKLGCDFAVLGPVLATASHPDAAPLGWTGFASAAADASIPVYALGGLSAGDKVIAWQHGAHGVALMRQAW